MKLKTLKDIDRLVEVTGTPVAYIHMSDIRDVAKEWIKKLNRCTLDRVPQKDGLNAEDLGMGIGMFMSASETNHEIATIIGFIKHFFNLEDDEDET